MGAGVGGWVGLGWVGEWERGDGDGDGNDASGMGNS